MCTYFGFKPSRNHLLLAAIASAVLRLSAYAEDPDYPVFTHLVREFQVDPRSSAYLSPTEIATLKLDFEECGSPDVISSTCHAPDFIYSDADFRIKHVKHGRHYVIQGSLGRIPGTEKTLFLFRIEGEGPYSGWNSYPLSIYVSKSPSTVPLKELARTAYKLLEAIPEEERLAQFASVLSLQKVADVPEWNVKDAERELLAQFYSRISSPRAFYYWTQIIMASRLMPPQSSFMKTLARNYKSHLLSASSEYQIRLIELGIRTYHSDLRATLPTWLTSAFRALRAQVQDENLKNLLAVSILYTLGDEPILQKEVLSAKRVLSLQQDPKWRARAVSLFGKYGAEFGTSTELVRHCEDTDREVNRAVVDGLKRYDDQTVNECLIVFQDQNGSVSALELLKKRHPDFGDYDFSNLIMSSRYPPALAERLAYVKGRGANRALIDLFTYRYRYPIWWFDLKIYDAIRLKHSLEGPLDVGEFDVVGKLKNVPYDSTYPLTYNLRFFTGINAKRALIHLLGMRTCYPQDASAAVASIQADPFFDLGIYDIFKLMPVQGKACDNLCGFAVALQYVHGFGATWALDYIARYAHGWEQDAAKDSIKNRGTLIPNRYCGYQ